MMNDDELRAWYGEEHVFLAAERGAIGTLLISDRLFKWVAGKGYILRIDERSPMLFTSGPMTFHGGRNSSSLWKM